VREGLCGHSFWNSPRTTTGFPHRQAAKPLGEEEVLRESTNLKRGAHGVRGGVARAAHHAVRVTREHHHRPEVVGVLGDAP
jgi:hypothetical protein